MTPNGQTRTRQSVVSVGGGGRGFVVAGKLDRRFVITAAHCLPRIPEPRIGDTEEYLYAGLLGPIGKEPHVGAECVFVDTVADIAVVEAPDRQRFIEDVEEYNALIGMLPPLKLAAPPAKLDWEAIEADMKAGKITTEQAQKRTNETSSSAWALSLDGRWFECTVTYNGMLLAITKGAERIVRGMSGSPIVMDDGAGIALVSTTNIGHTHCPGIVDTLPGWLLDIMLGDANPRRRS